jgi:integrase
MAVWTPAQLAEFLDAVRDDRLFALWWLLALRGLRRGEAAGLRWSDVDLDHATLDVLRARTTAGYQVFEGAPKTDAGHRTVALDKHTVRVLRAHHRREHPDGTGNWADGGYVFTTPGGQPLHPDAITRHFSRLLAASDLPPIRLHDLRHGAACLAHAAGADLKTIQQQLGHATIAITAHTYTTALPATQRHSARATAKLLLKAAAAHRSPKLRKPKAGRNKKGRL